MNVRETPESLIVTGTAMRSMVYEYPEAGKRALKPREALEHAARFTRWAPVTLGHTVETSPQPNDPLIGGFTVTGVTEDGRLIGEYEFLKDRTPAALLDAIRRGEPIPTSVGFDYLEGPGGDGYDYEQRQILLKHVAVFMPSDTRVRPRCSPKMGCGVGLDATRTDETRLICYDAQTLGTGVSDMTPEQLQKENDSQADVGKPIESASPPPPPAKPAKTAGDASPPPPRGDGAKNDSALDALRQICVDMDPSLAEVVKDIESPSALRQLAKRAKDAVTAADAALPVGQPDPRTADPWSLTELRRRQVEGLRKAVGDAYQYTRTSYTGGS